MADGSDKPANKQPAPEPTQELLPRLPRLNTAAQVRREMRRVYHELRQSHKGPMTPSHAGQLAYILTGVAKLIEVESLEKRLAELENQAGAVLEERASNGVPLLAAIGSRDDKFN